MSSTARVLDPSTLVAVTEHIERAGVIVWWRLSGSTIYDELAAEWAVRLLPEGQLPGLPGPGAALARAMQAQTSRRTLARPLAKGGRALVFELENAGTLSHRVELRARVDADGVPTFEPADHPLVPTVRADFVRRLGLLSTHDMGAWLVRMVERVDGVRLRDTGGVYFIPATTAAEWRAVTQAIHASTAHRLNSVPALRADDAVASVIDAVRAEARTAASELEAELVDGSLTSRKATTRAKRAEQLDAKLGRYEELLGTKMTEMRAEVERVRAALAAKALELLEVDEAAP